MRLPWFWGVWQRRGRRGRRQRLAAPALRVRQLERRRVLDAGVTSLLVGPTVLVDQPSATSAQQPLMFDWSAVDEAAAARETPHAAAQYAPAAEGAAMFATSESLVANSRPVLVVAVDQTINEGALLDLSGISGPPLGLFVDLDLHDTHTATVNWGDGTPTEAATVFPAVGAGALGGTHIYDDNGVYTVTVSVFDSHGASDTKSFQVTVLNVAPTATLSNDGPVHVSSSATVFFTDQFDPSTADTVAGFRYAFDFNNDGTFEVGDGTYAGSVTSSSQAVPASFFASPGVYTVSARIIDKDDGFTDYMTQIEVVNAPPVLANISGDSINEGEMATVRMTIVDPSPTDVFSVDVDWRDGSTATITGLGATDANGTVGDTSYVWTAATRQLELGHHYLDDGPGPGGGIPSHLYDVQLVVRDNHTASSGPYTANVVVHNVRPVLVVAANQMVNEGSLLDLSGIGAPPLGLFVDPGILDTHVATVDWGDGSPVEFASVVFAGGAGALGATHIYDDNGVYTVTVTVTDDDGGSDTKSFQVTVINVAPTAVLANDGPVDEGSTALVFFSGQFDPSTADTAAGFRYAYDFGNNGVFEVGDGTYAGSVAAASQMIPASFLADGPAVVTVRARIIDKDGGFTDYTTQIDVRNVVPVLSVAPNQTVNEGQLLDLTGSSGPGLGSFADVGTLDTHVAMIDWGDGSPIQSAALVQGAGSGTLGGSHVYADDGVYTVIVRLADDDMGAFADPAKFLTGVAGVDFVERSFTVTVLNVAPSLTGTAGLVVNEGQFFTLSELGVGLLDPGFDNPRNPLTPGGSAEEFAAWTIDWGDGTLTSPVSIVDRLSGSPGMPTTARFAHAAHVYADDGLYTVTIRMADDDMPAFHDASKFVSGVAGVDFVDRQFQILVQNVAPTLTITSVTPDSRTINEGTAVSFATAFSDPGFDNPNNPLVAGGSVESFTIDIDWGDGRQQVAGMATPYVTGSPGVPTTGTFGMSHIYADDGVYTVTVTVRDDDGGFDTKTFTVIVENVPPSFVPTVGGRPFQGTDVTPQGFTTIRVSYTDPGFDNPANPNAPDLARSISDPRHETFTHLIDWGDGTIDAFHTYVHNGVYTVTVTVLGPSGSQTFSFAGFDSSLHPVLTLVSSQALHNPAVAAQPFTYIVDWGDGVVQTIPLTLKAPGAPQLGSSVTTVTSMTRTSGDEGVDTTGSFDVRHQYLRAPNPFDPTADIRISVTVIDDNNGSVSDAILVRSPPGQVPNIGIIRSEDRGGTQLIPPAPLPVVLGETSPFQQIQSREARVAAGDLGIADERYFELVVVSPDGEELEPRHRIEDDALLDLRKLFATLPDGQYRIYLVRTDNNSRRLVIDVFVRRGRIVDPFDESEATRDRPPAGDASSVQPELEEEGEIRREGEGNSRAAEQQSSTTKAIGYRLSAISEDSADSQQPTADSHYAAEIPTVSFRWGAPLAAVAMAAGRGGWSRRAGAALQQADERDWQRLRRAGRLRPVPVRRCEGEGE